MPQLSRREACALLNVTQAKFKQLIDDGVVPPGVGLGPRSLRWDRDELIAIARHSSPAKQEARAA